MLKCFLKTVCAVAVTVVGLCWATGAAAQDGVGDLRRELEEQRRRNQDQQQRLEELERRLDAAGIEGGDSGASGSGGALYDKGFLGRAARNTSLGGYIDLEYIDRQGSNNTFRQHRFVPFIYSQLSDMVRFAAEIEFEYGGSDAAGEDGETKVEFAALDVVFSEAFGIRAGAILSPLGRFNLYHDSPVNDLTDRPLVDRFIIPTTMTEAGIGAFGTLYPDDESTLSYEVYLVNGFAGLEEDGGTFTSNISTTSGLRGARPSLKTDNNNSIAGVGRVAYSPFLGLEVGGSAHAGRYDDAGDNWLVVSAFDVTVDGAAISDCLSGWEFLGEVARADISRNTEARTNGVPDDMWGLYTQVNYHFMPESFAEFLPSVFGGEATFTAATRLDHVELDDERTERLTFGLNYRPIEDTVFKVSYQLNFEDWHRDDVDNDAFLLSIASYF